MQQIIYQSLGQLLSVLIYVAVFTLISYVGVVFRRLFPVVNTWLEANTSAAQQKLIKELGQQAFVYAETVFRDKNGADKLHEALAYFNKNMSKYGIELPYENIRNAVEQAWLSDKSLRTFNLDAVIDDMQDEPIPEPEETV
jgi:hypothetical protein